MKFWMVLLIFVSTFLQRKSTVNAIISNPFPNSGGADDLVNKIVNPIKDAINDGIDGVSGQVNFIKSQTDKLSGIVDANDFIQKINEIINGVSTLTTRVPEGFIADIGSQSYQTLNKVNSISDTLETTTNEIIGIGDDLAELLAKLSLIIPNPFDLNVGDDIANTANALKNCVDSLSPLDRFSALADRISIPDLGLGAIIDLPDFDDFFYILIAIPLSQDETMRSIVSRACGEGIEIVNTAAEAFYSSLADTVSTSQRRRRLSSTGCIKDLDGILCTATEYVAPVDSTTRGHYERLLETWPDLFENTRAHTDTNTEAQWREIKGAFDIIVETLDNVCTILDLFDSDNKDPTMIKVKLLCHFLVALFNVPRNVLNYGLEIADLHGGLIVASQVDTILNNADNIITNQGIIYNQLSTSIRGCIGTLYSNSGPINPSTGYNPDSVKMTQSMTYSMDIIINSFPNIDEWRSIFLLNTNSDRRPGIWINGDSQDGRGFHIFYNDRATSQAYDENAPENGQFDTLQSLESGTIYQLKIYSDPTTFIITVNGEVMYQNENANAVTMITDPVPIYFTSPTDAPADVTISNVMISSGNCLNINGYTVYSPENRDIPNIENRNDNYERYDQPKDNNNMIKLEMSVNELSIKVIGAFVVVISIGFMMGFIVGKCYGENNVNYTQKYKTVKYDTETDIE